MPIKINLLAEAQALEDLRRRDPVKRMLWISAFLVLLLLAWSSSLQLQALIAKGELNRLEAQINSHTNAYQQVMESQKRLAEARQKLVALRKLSSGRLLHGSLLDALERSSADHVRLVRLHTEQAYVLNEAVKPKTNATNRITPGKPATVTEKTVITLDAKDTANAPGDQVTPFKQSIADNDYFKQSLGTTNEVRLTNLSPPQSNGETKPFVLFTLECRYPEKVR